MGSKTAGRGIACVLALLAASVPAVLAADHAATRALVHERTMINLAPDFAEIVRLERPASTIIIGNPGVADATLIDERTVNLTAQAPGTTNMIVLDEAGQEIASVIVRVGTAPRYLTTFFHGTERRTYSCGWRCEPVDQ